MRNVLVIVSLAILVLLGTFAFKNRDFLRKPSVNPSDVPKTSVSPGASPRKESDAPRVTILAENLEIPWEIVFLPDKSMLLTERPGRVMMITADGKLQNEPVFNVGDIKLIGEGGLLGMALHPKFSENRFVYIYYTYHGDGDKTLNRVVRFKFDGKSFSDMKIIVDGIPGASNHNGGRIKFGPDGFLYITAGDSQNPSLAQDTNSLAGKILRVTDEGTIPNGNPFNNLVYSYGHRNPQGLAWDVNGQLWETEHGNSHHDEVNKILPGKNYGWPTIQGQESKTGMEKPFRESGEDTWAPSGLLFFNKSLYFVGLRGTALFEISDLDSSAKFSDHLKGEFGRLRDVVAGPDGLLYVLTSNRDGRGRPVSGDDKILVVNPAKL